MSNPDQILVTGGAGYVGSRLVPKLLAAGWRVKVLDLYLYGQEPLATVRPNPRLTELVGDIRDPAMVKRAVADCTTVIHLACISNDPSFELDPALGKSINHDAFLPLVKAAKRAGVERFIYASSSSVYGIKHEPKVTEDLPLEPLTDYSRYKARCETELLAERAPGFATLIIRPATVCGYAPRLRLDLTVNLLTNHAINRGEITVFGGSQLRPNLHIEDMCDLYVNCLEYPDELIDGQIFNAGYQNHSVLEIATMVREVIGPQVKIVTQSTSDLRSYHVSSERIRQRLGFVPTRTLQDAIRDLATAFAAGKVPDPLTDSRYYNIKRMQEVKLEVK